MPELISSGKVYRAVPPLFGVKQKGGMRYFTTKLDFTAYIQSIFANRYTLADPNGRKLTRNEVTNLFYKNIDYKDKIDFTSDNFACNPEMLEDVLYYISEHIDVGDSRMIAMAKASTPKVAKEEKVSTDETFDEIPVVDTSIYSTVSYSLRPSFDSKKLKNILKKKYRFIDMVEQNGVIRIEGLINSRYQYVFINDKFISACIPIIYLIKNNLYLHYQLNGENVSLYELMKKFDESIPSGLIRYKGLGEQDPKQLGVSALRPDGDRTLLRYTMESAKEEIESLRRIDSSMASLLREVKITKNEIE